MLTRELIRQIFVSLIFLFKFNIKYIRFITAIFFSNDYQVIILKSRKYIEDDKGMGDLFKPRGCLENIIKNIVLNKQK